MGRSRQASEGSVERPFWVELSPSARPARPHLLMPVLQIVYRVIAAWRRTRSTAGSRPRACPLTGSAGGTYNPDWRIVKQAKDEAPKLYLVRETKGTLEQLKLRGIKWAKMSCGKAHFTELGVDFKHVTSAAEV